ncbi:MAG: alpha/beta hydrolase family protein [Candidatus Sumerlaeota bacterium]|nr:alpha/beta hydrolase family protein [Candidatus Sumerlaeota bacterium]
MALIHCDFFSESLQLCMTMSVILPQRLGGDGKNPKGAGARDKFPTLYLLHGLSDDHSIWLRRTSIERYVAPLNLAVVMPAAHRSFYADMARGGQYWKYISEEVPRVAREFFPLSSARRDNFTAGLSMGGYGAFKLALNCPEKFCAAASLSGALWLDYKGRVKERNPEQRAERKNVLGDPRHWKGSPDDLIHAARRLIRLRKPRPRLYQCCGTEDFLYDTNQDFRRFLEPLGFDYTYEEEPGAHEWAYWDMKIQRVLEWLPIRKS